MTPTKIAMPTEGGRLGYIGKLYVRGSELFAIGGTYGASTLLLER